MSRFRPASWGRSHPGQKQAFQIPVRVVGRLSSPEQFDNIILKSTPSGLILLKDIGRSEIGAEDYSSLLEFDGLSAQGLGVIQLSNANALDVDKKAKAVLKDLSKSFPPAWSMPLHLTRPRLSVSRSTKCSSPWVRPSGSSSW